MSCFNSFCVVLQPRKQNNLFWIVRSFVCDINFRWGFYIPGLVEIYVLSMGKRTCPRSKNYKAYKDGVYWGGTEIDPNPERYVPGTTTHSDVSCVMAISVIEYCTTFCLLYPFWHNNFRYFYICFVYLYPNVPKITPY